MLALVYSMRVKTSGHRVVREERKDTAMYLSEHAENLARKIIYENYASGVYEINTPDTSKFEYSGGIAEIEEIILADGFSTISDSISGELKSKLFRVSGKALGPADYYIIKTRGESARQGFKVKRESMYRVLRQRTVE
jgi:hypothetical protein